MLIDRIPFPRPDDPLMSARQRAVDKAGGNGFMQVAATHAALLLAQGSGRLIRTTTDRGVVAVLDPRLATARYGGFLKASLPPMWTTTDPAVVRKALARLAVAEPVVEGGSPWRPSRVSPASLNADACPTTNVRRPAEDTTAERSAVQPRQHRPGVRCPEPGAGAGRPR